MSNNKETQEPLMGQPVELEVVGATEATQAAGEASVRPQREEPLKGRKAVRKPAGKEGEAREDAATEQPSEEAEAERVAEAIRQAIEEQAREDENPHSTNYTLRQIIGGEMLQTGVMKKNVGLMAVVGLFLFVSVTNRYSVQEKLKEINRLEAKLSDAKYRALSTGSKYTEKTRQSFVLQALRNSKDSILKIPDQPPYKIQVPEEGGQGE